MSTSSEQQNNEPVSDDELPRLFADIAADTTVVLAVSGGADSMAMMHLFARFQNAQQQTPADPANKDKSVTVVSIDHGLRESAHAECEFVARPARRLGFDHTTLTWEGEKPSAGIQAAARDARLQLLKAFSKQLGAAGIVVMMAHNKNDQAETVLMRLARGSGIEGLRGMQRMAPLSDANNVMLFRPLLDVPRSRLEATLRRDGVEWIDDPSNHDTDFERVRLRNSRRARDALNLSDEALARTARRMQKAHSAIRHYVSQTLAANVEWNRGAIAQVCRQAICEPPEHITLEVIAHVLSAMVKQKHPISLAKLEDVTTRLRQDLSEGRKPRKATLAGCVIEYADDLPLGHAEEDSSALKKRQRGALLIYREPGRTELPPISIAPGQTISWAGTLKCALPQAARTQLEIRPLGAELFARLRDEQEIQAASLLRRAAPCLPSFWHDARLVSVPHLDYVDPDWNEPAPALEPWPAEENPE